MPPEADAIVGPPPWIVRVEDDLKRLHRQGVRAHVETRATLALLFMTLEVEDIPAPHVTVFGPNLIRVVWTAGPRHLAFEVRPGGFEMLPSHGDRAVLRGRRTSADWIEPVRRALGRLLPDAAGGHRDTHVYGEVER